MTPPNPGPGVVELCAEPADRLDRFLAGLGLPLSRSRLQKLIRDGSVTVDGRTVAPSRALRGGERIRIAVPEAREDRAAPEAIPVTVVYEDPHLVVVDKPRGLVVHPSAGHPSGTLVNALLHRCPDLSGVGGVLRPGIVHRLDKDTSGLLVVAKDDETHRALQTQFRTRSVDKVYLAVVLGRLAGEGVVDRPIGRHPRDRKRMAVDAPRGRDARTRWRAVQELRGATLVEVRIETGRTHQIRVHLASLGHPVAGDPDYGGTRRVRGIADPAVRRRLARETSQALHAWKLAFTHPRTGEPLAFETPPPGAFTALVRDLGGDLEPTPVRP